MASSSTISPLFSRAYENPETITTIAAINNILFKSLNFIFSFLLSGHINCKWKLFSNTTQYKQLLSTFLHNLHFGRRDQSGHKESDLNGGTGSGSKIRNPAIKGNNVHAAFKVTAKRYSSTRQPGAATFLPPTATAIQEKTLPIFVHSRNLSDLGDRSEKMENRKQIFVNLQVNSRPIGQKFTEIYADLPFSQQIHSKVSRLLDFVMDKRDKCLLLLCHHSTHHLCHYSPKHLSH
jgi:hypothetical protein